MTWITETDAQNVLDLGGRLRNFILGYRTQSAVSFTGTGAGTLDAFGAENSVPNETITIACTDATTEHAEIWSVTGSVSGVLASATSNILYRNGGITFIISSDQFTAFAVTDQFTISTTGVGAMTTSAEAATLVQEQYVYNGTALSYFDFQVEFSGSGSETINIGHRVSRDIDNNRFYIELYGAMSNNIVSDVTSQPNGSTKTVIYTRNQPMTYWLIADTYGYKLVVQAGTTFRLAYCRYMIAFASPNQYPSPLVIGGDSIDSDTTFNYSTQNNLIRACFDPSYQALKVYTPGNTWEDFYNYTNSNSVTTYFAAQFDYSAINRVHPFGFTKGVLLAQEQIRPNLDGEYLLRPVYIMRCSVTQNLGEFHGLFAVSAYNTLTSGDIIQHGGNDHLVIQNIHRNGNADYAALRLV